MQHLRDYQKEAVDGVFEQWQTKRSTLVVQGTGLGKTVLASEIIRRMAPARTLFIAPRAELIYQAKDKIERFAGLDCAIEMADQKSDRGFFDRAPVVISTIQTQYTNNNARAFRSDDFSLLVIDEAHHFLAPAYRRIIDHYLQNPNLKVLGLTATPRRTDEIALGEIFESVASTFEILDGIKAGYLVDIQQVFVPVNGLDYSHIKSTCGDLNQAELAKVLEQEENIQGMIQPILEIGWSVGKDALKDLPVEQWGAWLKANGIPRKTIVFCASVVQAQSFSQILNRVIEDQSDFVSERTPKDKRKDILFRFSESNTLHFVCNVAILGEGYDNPKVEIIVQAKPTESLIVYQQTIGRATRPLPGVIDGLESASERLDAIAKSQKPFCTVVDFVGNSGRHKLVSCLDCLSGKSSEEVLADAIAKSHKESSPHSVIELLERTEQELADERRREKEREAAKKKVIGKSDYVIRPVSPFEAFNLNPARPRGWDKSRRYSEKQIPILQGMGLSDEEIEKLPYTRGKQLLDEHFRRKDGELCTLEQCKKLIAMGLNTNIGALEAAKITGIPGCSDKQARVIRRAGKDPCLFTGKTAKIAMDYLFANNFKWSSELDNMLATAKGSSHTNGEPKNAEPVFLGDRLSEKEIDFLAKYHYPRFLLERVHKDEGRRVKLRVINNGFKPLPSTDPDHPKNWKPQL